MSVKSLSLKEKKLTKAEIEELIRNDPDFIYSKKNNYSLEEFLRNNEKNVHDYQISKVLGIKKHEVNRIFKNVLKKLKNLLGHDFLTRE